VYGALIVLGVNTGNNELQLLVMNVFNFMSCSSFELLRLWCFGLISCIVSLNFDLMAMPL
jgi:hypothetical protein